MIPIKKFLKKSHIFLVKDNCKFDKKKLDLFTLILLSMISNNVFKKEYKGKVIKYFRSKL